MVRNIYFNFHRRVYWWLVAEMKAKTQEETAREDNFCYHTKQTNKQKENYYPSQGQHSNFSLLFVSNTPETSHGPSMNIFNQLYSPVKRQ